MAQFRKLPELDVYFQDNWRFRSNIVFDLGVRWEGKLSPRVAAGLFCSKQPFT